MKSEQMSWPTPTEEEVEIFKKWLEEHKKTCRFFKPNANVGAIGGVLTYCCTPTSIGPIWTVECACKEEHNFTDFSSW